MVLMKTCQGYGNNYWHSVALDKLQDKICDCEDSEEVMMKRNLSVRVFRQGGDDNNYWHSVPLDIDFRIKSVIVRTLRK